MLKRLGLLMVCVGLFATATARTAHADYANDDGLGGAVAVFVVGGIALEIAPVISLTSYTADCSGSNTFRAIAIADGAIAAYGLFRFALDRPVVTYALGPMRASVSPTVVHVGTSAAPGMSLGGTF